MIGYKRRALDLFCGAGGATRGLQDAGYIVHGVDITAQSRYCGETFSRADACIWGDLNTLKQFDLIWASPPCQHYSQGAKRWKTSNNHPDLIAAIRCRLAATGIPYVIENIPTARRHLKDPIMLCGTQFGLGVFRHRLFETSFTVPEPTHHSHTGYIGDGQYITVTGHSGGRSKRDGWKNGTVADAKKAMGINWMTWAEMAEAIPPAYSQYIASYAP